MHRNLLFTLLFTFIGFANLSAAPIAANCTQATGSYCCGFGILNVTFNSINNTTANATDGYKDYSGSISTSVLAGQTYTISIDVSGANPGLQNVRVWIDYNNDGTLDSLNELVFSANSTLLATGSIYIPPTAVKNTDLRMRVSADYELAPAFGPCKTLQNGQAEDYAVKILNNPNPPDVAFTADQTTTCSGDVSFTDKSLNVPTSWQWYFGDGSTSTQQNPTHSYSSNGTYTVRLKATNSNGTDEDSVVNYIKVTIGAGPITATCTPNTLAYCCQYGITNVQYFGVGNSINNSSSDASEGYKDFSCAYSNTVTAAPYNLRVTTGTLNPHDVKAWIDFNNDGVFNTTTEEVMNSTNAKLHVASVTFPGSAVSNTPLRLRITADYVGNPITPCGNPSYGQTEDYTVIFDPTFGITDLASAASIKLYPNPTTGQFFVDLTDAGFIEQVSINIHNIVGQQVYSERTIDKLNSIDLSELQKGIYFVVITDGKRSLTRKLILN